VAIWYWPARQAAHAIDPVPEAYWPAKHEMQNIEPAELAYRPTLHAEQKDAPETAEEYPLAQFVQTLVLAPGVDPN
jgi:hypothetical protein